MNRYDFFCKSILKKLCYNNCWFYLNNSETVKAIGVFQHLVTFHQRHSCQIRYPQLAQVPRYWAKLRRRNSDFWIFGQSLIKENYHNSRTSDDIDMKHGPLTKIGKNKRTSKKMMMTSCQQMVTSLPFFQFIANLELYGSQILGAQSMKLTFSSKVTFYVTKTENRTKKSITQLSHYGFE